MNPRYVFESEATESSRSSLDVRLRIKNDSRVSGLSSWWMWVLFIQMEEKQGFLHLLLALFKEDL